MIKRSHDKIILLSIILFVCSFHCCSTVSYKEIYPILADGKYDSEFPYKGASNELREISSTVHRINSSVIYKTYTFDSNSNLTLKNLKALTCRKLQLVKRYADQTNSVPEL